MCPLSCLVLFQLFVTPRTVARQSPLSMEFSRQGYWNESSFPPPGDLPDPGIKPMPLKMGIPYFIALCSVVFFFSFLFFKQIGGLWQLYVEQVYQGQFFSTAFAHFISVSHFGNSHNISSFFIIITLFMVICDQRSLLLLLR